MFGILALTAFKIGEIATGTLVGGQTLAFMTLALSQTIQAFNMRSEKSIFKIGVFSNKTLNWSCLASIALLALVLFTPVRIPFGLAVLTTNLYLIGLGLALIPLLVMEVAKVLEHYVAKKKAHIK
jgi:Ca2+-transporting ATPase